MITKLGETKVETGWLVIYRWAGKEVTGRVTAGGRHRARVTRLYRVDVEIPTTRIARIISRTPKRTKRKRQKR